MKKHERRFLIPDYSHPSYYFRLFHEGRPKGAEWAVEHTCFQIKALEDWAEKRLVVSTVDVWDEAKRLVDDLFRGTPAGEPASSVDPLADIW